jgi:hypothetical protein
VQLLERGITRRSLSPNHFRKEKGMGSRTAFRGPGVSKEFLLLFVAIVVLGLYVMPAFLARSASAPTATENRIVTAQPAPTAPCCHAVVATEPVDSFDGSGHGYVP